MSAADPEHELDPPEPTTPEQDAQRGVTELLEDDHDAGADRPGVDWFNDIAVAVYMLDMCSTAEMYDRAGPSFTCQEANAIAALFDAVGLGGHARALRDAHAAGDTEGDEHYRGESTT